MPVLRFPPSALARLREGGQRGAIPLRQLTLIMTTDTRTALAKIRAKLGLSRLDPRRLYIVDDGAYCWIGDRTDLSAADARALRAIDSVGGNPANASRDDRETAEAADYDAICNRSKAIAGTDGSGLVDWDDLPESWQDGSALGPISPL